MYANEDIYSGPNNPTANINPKIIGAFYINTQTAKLFVCTDNTINNNTWKICTPDVEIPEIPIPKFKNSVITTRNPFNYIEDSIWYHNTTDEIWFISSDSANIHGGIYVADIRDQFGSGLLANPNMSCGFPNHWGSTVVVPKGYKFMIEFGGEPQALQWTRISLSEITITPDELSPDLKVVYDLLQSPYIDSSTKQRLTQSYPHLAKRLKK